MGNPLYIKLCRLFVTVRGTTGHIVVIVSPLVNLMKDQVGKLVNIGIPAVTLSDISEDNMKAVERESL